MESVNPSQVKIVFDYLRRNKKITVAECAIQLNIFHLPRRIKDLEAKGIYIRKESKTVLMANGRKSRITVYYYNPEDEQLDLFIGAVCER